MLEVLYGHLTYPIKCLISCVLEFDVELICLIMINYSHSSSFNMSIVFIDN